MYTCIPAPDMCSFQPCYHGDCINTVTDKSFDYTCICDEGYTGVDCDLSNQLNNDIPSFFYLFHFSLSKLGCVIKRDILETHDCLSILTTCTIYYDYMTTNQCNSFHASV